MKRAFFTIWLTVSGIILANATYGANITSDPVSIPVDAVGITEEDFQTLKDAHCYFEATSGAVEISEGVYCDPLLAKLHDKIIFRAHHFGEMYWMNVADGLATGPHRYLPDGIYKTHNRYFIVAQGIKKRLRRNAAYDQIVAFAQGGKEGKSFSVPMTEENWNAHVKTCAEIESEWNAQRDNLPYSVLFGQCERNEIEGIWQSDSYLGRLILRVENNGSLYYVRSNNYWATVHVIERNDEAVINLAEDVASNVSQKIMKQLVSFEPLYN